MAHKKEYIRDGNNISEYNKKYYQKYKNKLNERSRQQLVLNPNLNKDYYAKNKEKVNELNKKNYEKHKEEILKQKRESKKKKE